MFKKNLVEYLLNPKNWWLPLLIIFVISMGGVTLIGVHTYTEAPPIPNFESTQKKKIYSKNDILDGQAIFLKYALMEYGSMFGDGANRGPDFTAEALHLIAAEMKNYYTTNSPNNLTDSFFKYGITEKVKYEIKKNNYQEITNSVELNKAQEFAIIKLENYYLEKFTNPMSKGAFKPAGYITDSVEIKSLTAFIFWGSWVCGVERPGENYSYTHNWPYDKEAGNTPSAAIILWSILGSLGLIIGLGLVLYYYGKLEKIEDETFTKKAPNFMSFKEIELFKPNSVQISTYKFFFTAIILFLIQVLSGILTVHDFVGFVHFFGFNISESLPITVTRSWHVQLSILWISACWIGASFFMMDLVSPNQPKYQIKLINVLFG